MVLLAMLLAGIVTAFHRTNQRIGEYDLRRRALAVAERQMEYLISTRQEPNAVDMDGIDDIDPLFVWEMNLKRISVDGSTPRKDLSNTVIEAVVVVTPENDIAQLEAVELVRRFADLKPRPGETIAVPYEYEFEEPDWYIALRQRLGREPTAEETFREMFRVEGLELGEDESPFEVDPNDLNEMLQ